VAAFGLSVEERQFLLGAAKGEGLFFARGSHVALQVEASPQEHRLVTTAPRELAEREVAPREGAPGGATRTPDVDGETQPWQLELVGEPQAPAGEEGRRVHRA